MNTIVRDPDFWLIQGDALEVLRELPDESVHCCVTSPPYWGLRDYGTEGQIGLEATPELFVESMVGVFREVRRVLRADGTLWLNFGDSYVSVPGGQRQGANGQMADRSVVKARAQVQDTKAAGGAFAQRPPSVEGLKPKDLVGIPWRVAFALQADGWYLRSDIVWLKPNPMPESVTDRPTKAHEYVFLLTKSPRYFFDQEAVREEGSGLNGGGFSRKYAEAQPNHGAMRLERPDVTGRNIRSVWEIATQPYPQAHFATFPEALPERCIKAGTSERGCCPECGTPWKREVERTPSTETRQNWAGHGASKNGASRIGGFYDARSETTGWSPSCTCDVYDGWRLSHEVQTVPCTVLDPFMGSGTTALVARKLGRKSIGIELSPEYARLAADRLKQLSLFAETAS